MDARLQQYDDKMRKAYEYLESDYGTIRAGRANPHVLDKIRVNYYGTPTPIQQVGNVTVPEARIIQIAPWERNMLKEIEKAIQTSVVRLQILICLSHFIVILLQSRIHTCLFPHNTDSVRVIAFGFYTVTLVPSNLPFTVFTILFS